jgi:hypothetical protein|tara:strand:+ start:624 stop:1025 length:402 start_codon:yes stop_codon:yes gene_type:complete
MKDMKKKNKNENWIAKMDMAAADKQAAKANDLQDAELAKTWKPRPALEVFKQAEADLIKTEWFRIRRAASGIRAHAREVDELEQKALLDGMKHGWNVAMRMFQSRERMRLRIANWEAKNKQDQLKVKKVNFKG